MITKDGEVQMTTTPQESRLQEARELLDRIDHDYSTACAENSSQPPGSNIYYDPREQSINGIVDWLTARDALRDQQVKAEALEEVAAQIRAGYQYAHLGPPPTNGDRGIDMGSMPPPTREQNDVHDMLA